MRSVHAILLTLSLSASLSLDLFSQSRTITTYVGPGMPVIGAAATTQPLDYVCSAVPDNAGGVYVASMAQNRVYRVAEDGSLTLVAGSGSPGFSGDGGPASSAQLWNPRGIALGNGGDLFIADTGNNRIRKVTRAGVISTVAGTGSPGFQGDGAPASAAQLNQPSGVALDAAGTLYIADRLNYRVRKVSIPGDITTVAGNGSVGFSGDNGPATSAQLRQPVGVALDASGSLFIADFVDNRIRKVTPNGVISTVAGNGSSGYSGDGGPATAAAIRQPWGVAFDSAGNLFIADLANNCIRRISSGGIISTIAGNWYAGFKGDGGPGTSALLEQPQGIALDSAGNLFIADANNSRVRRLSPAGIIDTVAGNGTYGDSGDGGPATSARLHAPNSVALDPAGNLFIADSTNHRVRKVKPAGVISTVAGNGTYGFSGDGGPAPSAQLNYPEVVAVDSAGNLFIADAANHRVRKVTTSGTISTVAGNGSGGYSVDAVPATSAPLSSIYGLALDPAGNLFIADATANCVYKVSIDGMLTRFAGNFKAGFSGDGGPAASAQLNNPRSLALDAHGSLFIADYSNRRVRKVTLEGVISTVAGNGAYGYGGDGGPAVSAQFAYPYGLAIDPAGNLFISDNGNACIRKVTPSGTISTVAGNGTYGFSGDGGPATSAQLGNPAGIALDAAGNLYVPEFGTNRVRKIQGLGTAASYFPQVAVGGGYTTIFTFGNSGYDVASGILTLSDQQGNPLSVNGIVDTPGNTPLSSVGSSFQIEIPPGGVGFVSVSPVSSSDPTRSGWGRISSSGGSLYSVATIQYVSSGMLQSIAGVLPSQPTQYATLPVDYDVNQGRSVGYAMANTTDESVEVKLALVDQGGNVVDDSVMIRLAAGQQLARFIHQDSTRQQFKGSMVLRAQNAKSFVVIALNQNQERLTVIPVQPGKAPHLPN